MPDVAEAVREDEFGGLDWLTMPGQDQAMVTHLIEVLSAELIPVNLIERCWVRDIAILTARLDFLRKTQWAMLAALMEEIAAEEARAARCLPDSEQASQPTLDAAATSELLADIYANRGPVRGSSDPRLQRLLGKAFASRMEQIDSFSQLEVMVMRERDRIISCRDRRHEVQVREILGMMQNGLLDSPVNSLAGIGLTPRTSTPDD